MKPFCWLLVLFGWLVAASALAQDAGSAEPPTPGLTVVGHGPDVPNGGAAAGPPACTAPQHSDATCAAAIDEPPALIVFVPVPILVHPSRGPHHRDGGSAASDMVRNSLSQPTPVGRFINDPSRRFINDPSHRFVNPPVQPPDR